MNYVKTANGVLTEVTWVAVSNIDGALRFCVINPDAAQLFALFTEPENCTTITRVIDGEDMQVFEGYTVFRGIQINYDGTAIVSLSKI